MKIGIDISQTAFPGTGVAIYTQNLVENLLKIDQENEYFLFFSSLRGQNQKSIHSTSSGLILSKVEVSKIKNQNYNSKIKNYIFPPLFLEFLWNRVHTLPVDWLTGELDVFHTSDWLEPPSRCPKVTTIHDLAIFKYPETFVPRGGHNIVENMKRKLAWVKKESRLIIAVSENTKRDIVEVLGIPEDRIRVVYEAADEIFSKQYSVNSIQPIKKKYGIEGKYILAVGTREPRKNIDRVIEAHNLLISQYPDLSLVIAGKFGWGEEKLKIKNEKLKILGYVPKEDLAPLYAGAECFVYPSLYEGFGLPVLEAMSSRCPVVTSNASSLPEVAGNAAVLVNPENIEDIAGGIERAMENRTELIKKGLTRAKEFSWEKTARQTLKIYEEVYADRN